MTTGHERDAETGLDYRGARFYDADVARFLSLDPLAAEFPAWSDYNYVLGNPVMLVDPDGRSASSPIFGRDGKFLGVDSEGYSGEVIIMDEAKYNKYSSNRTGTLDHKLLDSYIKMGDGEKAFSSHVQATYLNDAGLSAEGYSKVYTHVVKQLKGINFDKLEGGIINTIDAPQDEETGQIGLTNGDSHGNAKNLSIAAEAGTMINADGSVNVTTRLLGGKGQMTSVEHIQSTLGIHEYKGHGLLRVGDETEKEHSKAYILEYKHKETYDKLTPHQQATIKKGAGIK